MLTIPPLWRGRPDPLTGWWGGGDPLDTITLRFPSRQVAENYARREGITLEVFDAPGTIGVGDKVSAPAHEPVDPILPWAWDGRVSVLDLELGQPSADQVDVERALLNPAAVFAAPLDVARHPRLTQQEKLGILQRWEWDARLIEAAQAEGMPATGEPSQLDEVLEARRVLIGERQREDRARQPSSGSRAAPVHAPRRVTTSPEQHIAA